MAVIKNYAKEKLRAGELALGVGIRQARTVDIAKICKVCGYDWLFIDMEHNAMSMETAVQISVAALDAEITPVVRTAGHEHFHATRPLDGGAQGVVVPHVDTAVEARRVVSNCLYPPVGHRSVAGGAPQLEYESVPVAEFTRVQNENTLVVVMLESPQAIANVEEIASIEGIDVLLIGTNDLCAEMGIPGQFGHKDVERAYDRTIAACRANGKYAGLGGIYDQDLAQKFVRMGVRFILSGNDLSFFMAAARGRSQFLRQISLD